MKRNLLLSGLALAALALVAMGKRPPAGPPPAGSAEVVLQVEGMTCGGCERAVNTVLGRVKGVFSTQSSHEAGTAKVVYDPKLTSPEQLARAVNEKTEYKASVASKPQAGKESKP